MNSETSQIFRTAGVLFLGVAAAFSGMVVRERVSLVSTESTLNSLVATKDLEPIPEDDYFTELSKLIQQDYVDPVTDEMKLATGAVRGMVGSLRDLHSIYYEKDDFAVVRRSLQGDYEGIGADLAFEFPSRAPNPDEQEIPRIVVLSIVPGGPASRAGVRPGDWVDSVDGRWVINSLFLDHARGIQQKVLSKVLPQSAFDEVRRELRRKLDDAIPPMRAWKRLMVGKSGVVAVRLYRADKPIDVTLQKAVSERGAQAPALRLSLAPGADREFDVPNQPLRIDLRGSVGGDYHTALSILSKLGANGRLGQLRRKGRSALPVAVKSNVKPQSIVVLVDRQTRGTAEFFALALKRAGAKLEGQTAGSPVATEVASMPDGSGFTLNLGTFEGAKS